MRLYKRAEQSVETGCTLPAEVLGHTSNTQQGSILKRKKTMTAAAVAANRANAQKSTGPRRTEAVKLNAVKLGFASKSLFFENEEEKKTYEELLAALQKEWQPGSLQEGLLIQDMASSWWKLQLIDPLLVKQMRTREEASRRIFDTYLQEKRRRTDDLIVPEAELRSVLEGGWQCEQLLLTAGGETKQNSEADEDDGGKGTGRLQVRLADSSPTLMRYAAMYRRDFYRALGALKDLLSGN